MINLYTYYASTYGSGTYDGSSYGDSNPASIVSSGGSTGSSVQPAGSSVQPAGSSVQSTRPAGVLTNTGFDIAVIVTIACVIALLAIVVRIWKRPKKTVSID